jgi:hypothetical protein
MSIVLDGTNGITTLDGDVYAEGNILGTVAQTGGVPTGAIIERGSNANGEFVKYADGTLICTKVISVTTGVTTLSGGVYLATVADTDWATTFSATPNVSRQIISSVVNALWVGSWTAGGQPSTTAAGAFYLFSSASRASGAIDIHVTGIGRWF